MTPTTPPAPAATCDCERCAGNGYTICNNCSGNGSRYPERPRAAICWECRGRGTIDCAACEGSGEVPAAESEAGE